MTPPGFMESAAGRSRLATAREQLPATVVSCAGPSARCPAGLRSGPAARATPSARRSHRCVSPLSGGGVGLPLRPPGFCPRPSARPVSVRDGGTRVPSGGAPHQTPPASSRPNMARDHDRIQSASRFVSKPAKRSRSRSSVINRATLCSRHTATVWASNARLPTAFAS